MEYLNVLAAAAGSFVFGAIWYMLLAKPWVADSGVKVDADGKPANGSSMPFILAGLSAIIVAGMLRHVLATSGMVTIQSGIVSGAGVGAFFITPWIMMNYGFAGRPFRLTLIDGGYAVIGCAIMGAILNAF